MSINSAKINVHHLSDSSVTYDVEIGGWEWSEEVAGVVKRNIVFDCVSREHAEELQRCLNTAVVITVEP